MLFARREARECHSFEKLNCHASHKRIQMSYPQLEINSNTTLAASSTCIHLYSPLVKYFKPVRNFIIRNRFSKINYPISKFPRLEQRQIKLAKLPDFPLAIHSSRRQFHYLSILLINTQTFSRNQPIL